MSHLVNINAIKQSINLAEFISASLNIPIVQEKGTFRIKNDKHHIAVYQKNGEWMYRAFRAFGKNVVGSQIGFGDKDIFNFVNDFAKIDMVKKLQEASTYIHAVDLSKASYSDQILRSSTPKSKKTSSAKPAKVSNYVDDESFIKNYLSSRGINETKFYDDDHQLIKKHSYTTGHASYNIAFPLFTLDQDGYINKCGYALKGTGATKWNHIEGQKGIWISNPKALNQTRNLYIFESPIDAMSHYQIFKKEATYIAIMGEFDISHPLLQKLFDNLQNNENGYSANTCFDKDHAGKSYFYKFQETFKWAYIHDESAAYLHDKLYKDWNDYLVKKWIPSQTEQLEKVKIKVVTEPTKEELDSFINKFMSEEIFEKGSK